MLHSSLFVLLLLWFPFPFPFPFPGEAMASNQEQQQSQEQAMGQLKQEIANAYAQVRSIPPSSSSSSLFT